MVELVMQSPLTSPFHSAGMLAPDRISLRTLGQSCFLCLPVDVRQNIYRLSGVVQRNPISLNCEVTFKTRFYPELDVAFPTQLFRVNRIIHDEVTSIAYSENSFSIFHTHPSGFLGFYALSTQAKASLRSLTVGLCFRSRDMQREVQHDWKYIPDYDSPEESAVASWKSIGSQPYWKSDFRYKTMIGRATIEAWKRLVKALTITVTASQLALDVICDVEDYEIGENLVKPIYRLPQLRKCAIRLNHSPDPYLRGLAEKAVLYATGQFHAPTLSGKPFRFLDLPAEIQRNILSHTDLVCPTDYAVGHGVSFSTSFRWPNRCCKGCSDTNEACHCSVFCSAFSTWICDCWRPPTSLFLVNRLFNEYATEIFMSNTFLLFDETEKNHQSNPLIFLKSLSVAQIKFCRKIVFEFQNLDIDEDSKEPMSSTYHDFQPVFEEAIQFIYDNFNLKRLTLWIVDNSDRWRYVSFEDSDDEEDRLPIFFSKMERVQIEEIEWKVYQSITEPLLKLHGLEGFLIRFGCGPCYPRDDLQRMREDILEKRVMGDEYENRVDKYKPGKWRYTEDDWDEDWKNQIEKYEDD